MVEGTGLENRHAETYRGFESHPLRHEKTPTDRKISRGFLVKKGGVRTHGVRALAFEQSENHPTLSARRRLRLIVRLVGVFL